METDKEDALIESAIVYIKKYGIGFSIDNLCAATSISKRTFYSFFSTKNRLVEKIISRLIDKWESECAERVLLARDSKSSFLAIYTYHVNELTSFKSDFLNSLKLKFPNEYAIMGDYFIGVRKKLLKTLQDGRKNKEIKQEYNLEIFIEKEISFFEYLQKKHHAFPNKEDYLKLLNLSLEGLSTGSR
jgi:AcrR family transcriptional regulator